MTMLRYDAGEGRRSTTLSVGVAIDSILRVRIIYYLCSGLPSSYFIFENLKILQYSPGEHPTDSGAVTQDPCGYPTPAFKHLPTTYI